MKENKEETQLGSAEEMTFEDCKKAIVEKYGLGKTLVTGQPTGCPYLLRLKFDEWIKTKNPG